MILALTITFSAIWIPIILSIITFILTLFILNDESRGGWLGGELALVLGTILLIIVIPFFWTSYFTVLYFLK
jgi:hypothetical protein